MQRNAMHCITMQVFDMERRQAAAAEREARKAARVALKERQERERNTKLKMEEEAYEMQLQVSCCLPALLSAALTQSRHMQSALSLQSACIHLTRVLLHGSKPQGSGV